MDDKNTNDIKAEDFEMGGAAPQINTYGEAKQTEGNIAESDGDKPLVNPKGPVPPESPAMPPKTEGKTIGQAKIIKPSNPEDKKKAIIGCLGGFGAILLVFLVLAFVFIAQSDQTAANPIAKLLNLDQGSFVNGLITLVHIIFIILSLTFFIFTMVGLFKASMAKKDDLDAKKRGFRMSLIAGILLFAILVVWGFVYIYLDSKRVDVKNEIKAPIVTEPEETLNLTAPVDIRFDASNIGVTKKFQIISYDWDFGDGEKGTSQIVSHTYESKGVYDVVLGVTKQDKTTGEKAVDTYTSIVSIQNEALNAIIEAVPQSGPAPLTVKFDATKSADPDGKIDRYEWDFNEDGQFDDATGVTAEYTFEKIGKYMVALRVVSTTDEFDVSEKEIIVEESKLPEAVITAVNETESYTVGTQYVFKSESESPNGTIEKYEWDFGDGSKVETTKTVSHEFKKEGTYDLTLKVTDEKDEEGEVVMTITVGVPQGIPGADIKTEPAMESGALSLEGEVPFSVVFDASGSTDSDKNIVDYSWDMDGDGEDDKFGQKVSYTFNLEGTYTAKLTVTDSDDNKGTATYVVKVKEQGVKADLKADKTDGTSPLTVQFDASGSTYQKGKITSYEWNFGDGTKPSFGNASIGHKYTEIGTYTAKVTAIGADNKKDTAEITITVRDISLAACFVSVFEKGPAPLKTSFDPGCTTGTVKGYYWDFGDGENSSEVSPSHTFQTPGDYTVTLEVTDADNTVSSSKLVIKVSANE